MSDVVTIGDPPIPIRLRRSKRAKRYSLRISNSDGSVSLTIPGRATKQAALEFARDQQGWLRKNLAKRPQEILPAIGGQILLDGRLTAIEQGAGRGVRLEGDILYVPGSAEETGARLRGFLRTRARDQMVAASERYAQELGVRFARISLRDTRSRWGSCTSEGNLMYSWRLTMAPKPVRDYVAAHEVCHLIEMNHSARYWELVAQVYPDYRDKRDWLHTHGIELHRYRF